MEKKLYVYKKTTEDTRKLVDALNQNKVVIDNCRIFIDSNRDFLNYKLMKEALLSTKGIVFINSLHSIACSKERLLEELNWYKEHRVELVVADMPSTYIVNNRKANLQNINVLIDVFLFLQINTTFEFQNPDSIEGGRKKIRFPENWESNFLLYESKKISANEFQHRVGLKRATFFNLLSEYKQLIKLNQHENVLIDEKSKLA